MTGCVIYNMLPFLYVQLFRQGMPQPGGPVEQRQTNSLQVSHGATKMTVCHTLGSFTMFDSYHIGLSPTHLPTL